jgi:hypothetical protein
MTASECLLQIRDWLLGDDWTDWKTRTIPGIAQNNLLAQREINKYLFEVRYEDTIDVYLMPGYDDMFHLWGIDGCWYINSNKGTPLTEQSLKTTLEGFECTQAAI